MAEKLLYGEKENLWICYNRPLSEAFLNQFHKTVSAAQVHQFEKLARELKGELETLAMEQVQYIAQINSAYQRHLEYRRLDPFVAMDDKSLKYVLQFLEESIKEAAKEVNKTKAKSLTG